MTAVPVDCTGMVCPLPLLRAKAAFRGLRPGDALVVRCTDPDAPVDFGAWAAVTGVVVETRDVGDAYEITVFR